MRSSEDIFWCRETMVSLICGSEAFKFLFEKNNCQIENCSICDLVPVTNIPPIEQVDEGCSFGFFMDAARQRGWTVADIDVPKYAADYATPRLWLLVIT